MNVNYLFNGRGKTAAYLFKPVMFHKTAVMKPYHEEVGNIRFSQGAQGYNSSVDAGYSPLPQEISREAAMQQALTKPVQPTPNRMGGFSTGGAKQIPLTTISEGGWKGSATIPAVQQPTQQPAVPQPTQQQFARSGGTQGGGVVSNAGGAAQGAAWGRRLRGLGRFGLMAGLGAAGLYAAQRGYNWLNSRGGNPSVSPVSPSSGGMQPPTPPDMSQFKVPPSKVVNGQKLYMNPEGQYVSLAYLPSAVREQVSSAFAAQNHYEQGMKNYNNQNTWSQ
jgi:hypothetical protein